MRRFFALAALAAAFALAPSAHAQGAFMPYLGYNFEGEAPTLGVAFRYQPALFPVALQPGVEVTLDNGTNIQVDLNGVVNFGGGVSPITPWIGAGVALLIPEGDNADTQVAANALVGAAVNAGFVRPFAQGRLTTDFDFTAFSAHVGVILDF
jgi:hypothetical protein